ncbi:MAG: class I SAM-dependent methyltransferase [Vicinamibacterales bacterium]
MSGFTAQWLALREPADAAARSTRLDRVIADALVSRPRIRVVDLGCGAGSNLRYLTPRLPPRQEWLLVDDDPGLLQLAATSASHAQAPVDVSSRVLDLGSVDDRLFARRDLVTASALLDLVSEAWLVRVVERCRQHAACVLAVLSYDGRIECTPTEDEDDEVRALVNRHQRREKGFGPALGPDAGARAEALLLEAGFHVWRERSDWVLDARHRELQLELIDGWAAAASEIAPSSAARIAGWRLRRRAHVDAGDSHLRVGHDDVAALPASNA